MFILRTRLFIFSLGVATIVTGQPVQEHKTGLRYGRFNIGFQHRILFDKTRSFEYTPGDSSVKSISALGRPLLLSFFSPTNERNQKNRLKIKDLFLFNAEKPIQKFIDRFTSYQLLQSKRYAIQENLPLEDFAGDPIRYEQLVDLLFDKHLNTQLRCFTVSEKPGAQYPVVIYHQGLGGTLDENSILLEFLASHGFVVVTSSFISGYGESTIGVGDTDASMKDLDFIIDYLKKQKIGDTDNIFLMGHSFGANTLLAYPQVGTHPVAGIIPIDSDYGYHLRFMMPQKMQPDLITQANYVRTRILAIGRPNATFRMIDLLDKTER
ncbi:MAG: alpha/beta hydrolase family protein, partial [Ferruginibacter sp.]